MNTGSQCPACGREVPGEAQSCPECGEVILRLSEAPLRDSPRSQATAPQDEAVPSHGTLADLSGEETDEIEIVPEPPDTDSAPSSIEEADPVQSGEPSTPGPPSPEAPNQQPHGTAGRRGKRHVTRRSYASLCQTLPGRPYLAMIGTDEPPEGYPIRHCLITIGRGQENHLEIDDPAMSSAHALLALVGRDFLVVDRGSEQGTFVNQYRVTQSKVTTGDVIEVGRTRFVFAVVPGAELAWGYRLLPLWSGETPSNEPDSEAEEDQPDASIILRNKTSIRQVKSDGRPVLIGSDRACRMPVKGEDVATFHAQVYWGSDGIHVRGLRSSFRVLLDGEPIRSVRVQPGQEIAIGAEKLEIQYQGDVVAACRQQASDVATPRPLALTCVSGAAHGASGHLPADDDPLLLGRDPLCDLHVEDPAVPSRQVFLTVREDRIDVENLSQEHPLRVNNERTASATVKPGDVIAIGRSEFLVHRAV